MLDNYIKASTSKEVLSLLRRHRGKARVIGGGTMLYEFEFRGFLSGITMLIDISRLGLNYVEEDSSGLRIGASTTFTQLLESKQANSRPAYGALTDALRAIRPVQIRNVATVGGALSSGVPALDLPPASVALGAKVTLVGPKGRRTIDLKHFFLGLLETAMKPAEFLREVRIPRPSTQTGSAFQKLETNAVDWATLSVATSVTLQRGRVSSAKIVFGGGVGEVPNRAIEAEAILEKAEPTKEVISRAAEEASDATQFTADERASAEYRREISKVIVRESLSTSIDRARKDSG